MAVDRKILNSLLGKLGVEHAGKLPTERAQKKVGHRLQTKGLPADLTDAEKALIEELGFSTTGNVPAADKEEVTETEKPEKAAKTKAEKPATTEKIDKVPKAAGGKGRKPSEGGGMAAFRDAFKNRKHYERKELIEAVSLAGKCSGFSVGNYIALAKKGVKPFGFQLEEATTSTGKKNLTKVG